MPITSEEDRPIEELISPKQETSTPNKYAKLNTAYDTYSQEPTPENLNEVVKRLEPTISYAVNQGGSYQDPLIKSEARIIAAEAIKSYDPNSGTALPTWTSTQLMRLKRKRREQATPLKLPDRVMTDAWSLEKAEREFIDENSREPDVVELADKTGISVKRISKVRESFRMMPSELSVDGMATQHTPDYLNEALEYVHHDADYLDRKILEHKTGFGGAEIMTPSEIAKRFKITPSQLSRRSKKITFRIQEIQDMLEDL